MEIRTRSDYLTSSLTMKTIGASPVSVIASPSHASAFSTSLTSSSFSSSSVFLLVLKLVMQLLMGNQWYLILTVLSHKHLLLLVVNGLYAKNSFVAMV